MRMQYVLHLNMPPNVHQLVRYREPYHSVLMRELASKVDNEPQSHCEGSYAEYKAVETGLVLTAQYSSGR